MWVFCKAVLAGAGRRSGLSVSAFCKAVLAGAGRSSGSGLSGKLCWQELCDKQHCMWAFCEFFPVWMGFFLDGAFCEAVLAGVVEMTGTPRSADSPM